MQWDSVWKLTINEPELHKQQYTSQCQVNKPAGCREYVQIISDIYVKIRKAFYTLQRKPTQHQQKSSHEYKVGEERTGGCEHSGFKCRGNNLYVMYIFITEISNTDT
jgi:hypothetical protein